MSSDPSIDRRIAKTRRALHHAFVEIVMEKGWEATRVQDICERADVGRTTFYAHFADKEELLAGSLVDLGAMLREGCPDSERVHPLWFVRGFLHHAELSPEIFRALLGEKGGGSIPLRFRQFIAGLAREGLQRKGVPSWRVDSVSHFLAGGFLDAMAWWLEADSSVSRPQLEAMILDWSRSAIESIDHPPVEPASSAAPAAPKAIPRPRTDGSQASRGSRPAVRSPR